MSVYDENIKNRNEMCDKANFIQGDEWNYTVAHASKVAGYSTALHLQMEAKIASKVKRLGGLASSNILYQDVTGKLSTVDFEDILNGKIKLINM
ncbi:hypothetical protein A3Q56_02535 [Intoshia linei]|uniref:Uncharacterized protein n=1 Tax=Intoshia linei TaxID=1819745 RepID=A0A177B825_9BILA|nr:hypothetical protein A3Q56_02535 [Intoshia linei]